VTIGYEIRPSSRARGGLGTVGGAELAQDVRRVLLDRVQRDEQLGGHLAVRPAGRKQPQDLELALGEPLDEARATHWLPTMIVHDARGYVLNGLGAPQAPRRRRTLVNAYTEQEPNQAVSLFTDDATFVGTVADEERIGRDAFRAQIDGGELRGSLPCGIA
jgi:hypothetical protein